MAPVTKLISSAWVRASSVPLLVETQRTFSSVSGSFAASTSGRPANSRGRGNILLGSQVSEALNNGEPVVALESTLLTHGLPQPENLQVGYALEARIRAEGAVPATVGVLGGRFIVGLSRDELSFLADVSQSKPIKASRRDLPVAAALGLNAGTTVAATLAIASGVSTLTHRIRVFATGGTGGVHKGAESSMDISADLEELPRSPMGLVSAGFKSFLDARRSLEYLETRGCTVLTLNAYQDYFPAFFSRYNPKDPLKSPYNVASIEEAARILFECLEGQLQSTRGLLLAVSIPDQWTISEKDDRFWSELERITSHVEFNTKEGSRKTPLILEQLNQATKGQSLKANRALLENNATVGAKLALQYQLLAASTVGSLSKLSLVGDRLPELSRFPAPQSSLDNNNSPPIDPIDAASEFSEAASESQHGNKG